MKKKILTLTIALIVLSGMSFGQINARWVKGKFTHILKYEVQFLVKELSSAPSHTSGYGTVYVLSADNKLYFKNDSGTATELTTGSASGYTYKAVTTATPSAAFTIDWTANHNHQVTITGTTLDITFTNPAGPCRLTLKIIQGDGDDTIDWTNEADLKFPGGVDPVLTTTSGYVDFLTIWWDGSEYVGVMNYDFR